MSNHTPNSYFQVTKPTEIWVRTGSKPGNHYYGASRIYDVVGEKVVLNPGADELHYLFGGLFVVMGPATLAVFEVLAQAPERLNRHFEKNYTPNSWYYNQIIEAAGGAEIPKSAVYAPATYRVG